MIAGSGLTHASRKPEARLIFLRARVQKRFPTPFIPPREKLYQIQFLEIGTDKDHVHVLAQAVPRYSVTKVVTIIKSLTAKEIFRRAPQVKRQLWGGELWTDEYYASTVGKHGNENMIGNYVKQQGDTYQKLYDNQQLALF